MIFGRRTEIRLSARIVSLGATPREVSLSIDVRQVAARLAILIESYERVAVAKLTYEFEDLLRVNRILVGRTCE